MLIGINTSGYKETPLNFTSRIRKGIFETPKQIPGLRCPICEHIMLTKQDKHLVLYKYVPLSPTEFIKLIPSSTRFEVPQGVKFVKDLFNDSGIEGVRDFYYKHKNKPIEGVSIRIAEQIKEVLFEVIESLKIDNKEQKLPRKKIINNIKKIRPELPKEIRDFCDLLLRYTKEFPNQSLARILKNEKLFHYHSYMAHFQKIIHDSKINKTRENFLEIIKKRSNEEISDFITLTEEAIKIANDRYMLNDLRRTVIDEIYAPFLEKLSNKTLRKKLEKEIHKIDLQHFTSDYLFCLLHKKENLNDKLIIDYIISSLEISYEHIIPESKGGLNTKGNGVYMCRHCNSGRGNIHYNLVNKVYPKFPKNIQKQVSRLTTYIKKNALKGYDKYPQEIKCTMKEYTGQDINIERFLQDMKKVVEKRISDMKAEILRIKKLKLKLKKTQSDLLEYNDYISELENSINYNHKLLESIERDLSKKNN